MRLERLPAAAATWAVVGELDALASPELAGLIRRELEADHDLVLDLSQVSFLESTALGVLLAGTKRASGRGLRLALRTNASAPVMHLLNLTATRQRFAWTASGDDDGTIGVREPRRPRPSAGGAAQTAPAVHPRPAANVAAVLHLGLGAAPVAMVAERR